MSYHAENVLTMLKQYCRRFGG